MVKEEFHTWDTWCLLKLEDLGRISKRQWAFEMGYNYPICLDKMIKNNIDKLKITHVGWGNKIYCEIKDGVKIRNAI